MALQVPPGFCLVNLEFWVKEAHFYPEIVYHPMGHSGPGWEGPYYMISGQVGPDDAHGQDWLRRSRFIDTGRMPSSRMAEEKAQRDIDHYIARVKAGDEEVA